MSTPAQTSYDLVEAYYAAFNANDPHKMLSFLSDDIAHDTNQGSRRHGKQAFAEFCAHMDQCYAEQLKDIVIMASENGRHVAAEFVVHGTYKATDEGLPEAVGQQYVLPAGTFFEVIEGKIARITTYYNLQDWLKQVA